MATQMVDEVSGGITRPRGGPWMLPAIPDRWWPLVRTVLGALLLGAVVANVVGAVRFYERQMIRPFSHLGLGWTPRDGKVVLMGPHTREAAAAGIVEGQRIVAIDGKPISDNLADIDTIQQSLVRPEGSAIVLTTVDEKGTRADHRLTRLEANIDESLSPSGLTGRQFQIIDSLTAVTPAIALLIAAALLLRSRRRETIIAVLTFAFIMMAASTNAASLAYTNEWVNFVAVRVLGSVWIFSLFLSILAFPDGAIRGRLAKFSLCLIVLALIVDQTPWNRDLQLLLLLSAILPMIVLWRRRRSLSTDQGNLQVRAAMFGLVAGFALMLLGMISWMLTNRDMSNSAFTILGSLFSQITFALSEIAMALGLVVSILRYRLYDVDTIISRSAAYGTMTVGFIAIFAGVEKLAEIASEEYFGEDMRMISGAGAAAIAAAIIAPMHNRIHHWAERRFHSTLQVLRSHLPAVVEDLRETATLDELGQTVVERLGDGVRASGCELRVAGQTVASVGSDCSSYEYAVPLAAAGSGENIGELVLGPRPDGSGYNKDEREALDAVAQPIGRAVDVVRRREAKEKALDRRIAAIEAAILGNGREGKIA